jgi:hypothetical protein
VSTIFILDRRRLTIHHVAIRRDLSLLQVRPALSLDSRSCSHPFRTLASASGSPSLSCDRRTLTLLPHSIISVITGIPSLFYYGLTTGGPAVMVWGFVVVAFFTMLVGLAMAEICSTHPTSGGPYFWAAMLAPPKRAPLASWVTGWFNLLGQVAVTTGISYVSPCPLLQSLRAPLTRKDPLQIRVRHLPLHRRDAGDELRAHACAQDRRLRRRARRTGTHQHLRRAPPSVHQQRLRLVARARHDRGHHLRARRRAAAQQRELRTRQVLRRYCRGGGRRGLERAGKQGICGAHWVVDGAGKWALRFGLCFLLTVRRALVYPYWYVVPPLATCVYANLSPGFDASAHVRTLAYFSMNLD